MLEASLDVTTVALAAAWPELHDLHMAREHDEPSAALDILQRASDLVAAINRYRLALALAEQRRDVDACARAQESPAPDLVPRRPTPYQ